MTNLTNTLPSCSRMLEGVHNNTPPSSQKAPLNAQAEYTHRETHDAYFKVIAQPEPRWRKIVCKHGLQWIVQKRSTEAPNTGVWVGFSYCTTRNALIEACSRLDLLLDANTEAVLHALPERITGTLK